MIVDPGAGKSARSAGWVLMPIAVAALSLGLAALVLRPSDPESAVRARARLLEVLPTTAPPTEAPAAPRSQRPTVLSQRTLLATLPPPLVLPPTVAIPLVADSPDARKAAALRVSTAPPSVYRLEDGRLFVVQSAPAGRGRPYLTSYTTYEDATVRGRTAELITTLEGPLRALVWWSEGPVTYYVYSSTVTLRELVRFADELR